MSNIDFSVKTHLGKIATKPHVLCFCKKISNLKKYIISEHWVQ